MISLLEPWKERYNGALLAQESRMIFGNPRATFIALPDTV